MCHNGDMDCIYCTRPATRLKLCNAHYKKLKKYGDPLAGRSVTKGLSRLVYYLSYVDVQTIGECWPWTGGIDAKGYGRFNSGGDETRAHRYGFTQIVRPLKPGETVDHLCHNQDPDCHGGPTCPHRRCQNPAHWSAAGGEQNADRARNTRSLAVTKARDIANAERQRARFKHRAAS